MAKMLRKCASHVSNQVDYTLLGQTMHTFYRFTVKDIYALCVYMRSVNTLNALMKR